MSIPENTIYPRTGDKQTVYLKNIVTNPNIEVGDYTMYNDFVADPCDFQKNNVLYHYPINHDRLVIGKFCSIGRRGRVMSKYEPLWQAIGGRTEDSFALTYAEIEEILGFPIDHAFLTFKKELPAYGYEVGKISMKAQTVAFKRCV